MLIAVKNVITRLNGWLAMPILRKSHAPFTLADAHGHWQPDGRAGTQSAMLGAQWRRRHRKHPDPGHAERQIAERHHRHPQKPFRGIHSQTNEAVGGNPRRPGSADTLVSKVQPDFFRHFARTATDPGDWLRSWIIGIFLLSFI